MKVQLITVSHRQPEWVVEGAAEYGKRLPREWGFRVVEIKPGMRSDPALTERIQAAEAERVRAALPKSCRVIAFDEAGEPWSTKRLAERLARWQQDARDVAFVIGGADGIDPAFLAAAEARVSLSAMTLPHGLVRIVAVEQLYRASSILRGHPYHR